MTSSIDFRMSPLTKVLPLGRALYWIYHVPKGMLKRSLKRDPIRQWGDHQARRQMEVAAYHLPPLIPSANPHEIYFLSGQRFWYQTCFCAYSMVQQAGQYLRPVIYDDGSLANAYQQAIRRIFPDVRIITAAATEAALDQKMPASQFPYLRSRRKTYFNLRKLTDIYISSPGWKLVLDSDMLFFRRPTLLLDWLQQSHQPCHMLDVESAYGYSTGLMQKLAQAEIPDRINVGICGLNGDAIDWDELEFWCKTLIETEGTSYYQEQALIAMLMAKSPRLTAPADQYHLMPNQQEARTPQAVMHHYVADSKPWYFRHGWHHVVAAIPTLAGKK